MIRVLLIWLLATLASGADTYLGHTGHWLTVEATGYSPQDDIDSAYRETKGADRYMTAGRISDVRITPYGIATGGKAVLPLRSRVIVPEGEGFPASDRIVLVDDVGAIIRRRTEETGVLHIDLRFKTTYSAERFGHRTIRIFVIEGDA